jgi:spoIIIJ-associated protein
VGDIPGEGFGAVVNTEGGLSGVADLEPDDELEDEFDDDVDEDDDEDELDDEFDEADDVDDDEADDVDDDVSEVEADEDDEDDEDDAGDATVDEAELSLLEQEGEIAADYIEGLLDIADLDGDIDMDVEGDRAVVSVVGATLDELVGEDGEVLEALQELTRLAVHRQTGVRARLMLDVGGFRVRRRNELAELGRSVASEVARTGEPKKLAPMSPFERKIIHDAVADAGLRSESEGEEPHRRVVVFPAG